MNAHDLLKELIREAVADRHYWKLKTSTNPNPDYDKRRITRALDILGESHLAKEIIEGKHDFANQYRHVTDYDRLINGICDSLKQDIADCTNNHYSDVLEQIQIGIMPTGQAQAYCLNQNRDGKIIDGHVICINQGLYFCLQLIAKALVVKSANLDKSKQGYDCANLFHTAIKLLLQPDSENIEQIFFHDLTAEVDGELSAYQGKVATMILQFVVMHEYAHIVHKDLTLIHAYGNEFYALTNETNDELKWKKELINSEYRADAWALSMLNNRARSHGKNSGKVAWANFSAIALFFFWLEQVELHHGKTLQRLHPKPMERYDALLSIMQKEFDSNLEVKKYINDIEQLTIEWGQLNAKQKSEET